MEFLSDLEHDVGKCKADITGAWDEFEDGFKKLSGHKDIFSSFDKAEQNITRGINDLGRGLNDLAAGVNDCHLKELATIIAKLSLKFSGVPELKWINDVLKILIDGVSIEKDLANALLAFSDH